VYEDVLTKLRHHGSYALSGGAQSSTPQSWVGGDLRLALNWRDDDLKMALKQRDDDTKRVMIGMNEALKQRDEDTKLMLVGMLEAMQRYCKTLVSGVMQYTHPRRLRSKCCYSG